MPLKTHARYNWNNSGYPAIYDAGYETRNVFAPVVLNEDFITSSLVIPAGGSAESGMLWSKMIVGAGPPTVAIIADQAGGVVGCALTADSQKQDAGIYTNDNRSLDITKGLIFEARVKVTVVPTLVAEVIVGLVDDWTDGLPDSATYQLCFNWDGSADIRCQMDDNTSDLDVDSGVNSVTTVWLVLRIDCTDVTDIKFYIDGTRVVSTTTYAYAATGANAILQPYIGCYKASGAGLGTIYVDYIRAWQSR